VLNFTFPVAPKTDEDLPFTVNFPTEKSSSNRPLNEWSPKDTTGEGDKLKGGDGGKLGGA
jgi:hypothetical protein